MMDEDVYYKKELAYKYHGHNMRFRVSQDLFSSYRIDIGTQFLLRTLLSGTDISKFAKILDLGCGYGPIGLTLKTLVNGCELHMTDRDALALEYSRQNAELNGLEDVRIYGSLGYDNVTDADFDLIISNIPGKAGEPVIADFLRRAGLYLREGGMTAIVVISPLEQVVSGILQNMPNTEVLFRKNRSGHAVFHYRFTDTDGEYQQTGTGGFDRGIYLKDRREVSFPDLSYRINTVFDLPEAELPDHRSELLIEAAGSIKNPAVDNILLFNPGQGHAAVATWLKLGPDNIFLVDRDLLSLRTTESNLVLNGCPSDRIQLFHRTGIGANSQGKIELVIGTVRENEGVRAVNTAVSGIREQLAPGGKALLSAGSTAITRIIAGLQTQNALIVRKREKRKGNSLLVLEKR